MPLVDGRRPSAKIIVQQNQFQHFVINDTSATHVAGRFGIVQLERYNSARVAIFQTDLQRGVAEVALMVHCIIGPYIMNFGAKFVRSLRYILNILLNIIICGMWFCSKF